MPKHGFSLDTVPPILINTVDKLGWSLCIGAGTSTPLFPDWYSLVETLSTNILPPELLSKMLGIQDKKAAKPVTTKSRKGTARKGKNWRSKNTSTSSFAEYHKKHR